jgi:PTS system mannose-specific IIA component
MLVARADLICSSLSIDASGRRAGARMRRFMIGKLLVSHGPLASELLAAAETIAGELHGFGALCLAWSEKLEESQHQIAVQLEQLDDGDGVLILTDMFGDTPCNASLSFLEPGEVEVVTGVNLPMVVRLACGQPASMNVTELARWTQSKGRGSICLVSEMPTVQAKVPGDSNSA